MSPGEAASPAAAGDGGGGGGGSSGRNGFHLPHHLGFFPTSPHLPFGLTHGHRGLGLGHGHGHGPTGQMPPASPLASSAPAQLLSGGPPSSPSQHPARLPPLGRAAAEALRVALDCLGATAVGVEGLYRVSGSKVEVDRLKLLLEVGAASVAAGGPQALAAAFPDKHVVAGAVKKVSQRKQSVRMSQAAASVSACVPFPLFDRLAPAAAPFARPLKLLIILLRCACYACALKPIDQLIDQQVLQEHEPLLTYNLYESFLLVATSNRPLQQQHQHQQPPPRPLEMTSAAAVLGGGDGAGGNSKEVAYRELLAMLPPLNRALLAHLLLHLKQVRGGKGTFRGVVW